MAERMDLRGSSIEQRIGGTAITVLAPGLLGSLTYHGPRSTFAVRRETTEKIESLDSALAEAGLEDRHTFDIAAATPAPPEPGELRRLTEEGTVARDEMEIRVPADEGEVQFAIYQDEQGLLSLHFPEQPPAETVPERRIAEARSLTYRIKLRRPSEISPGAEPIRGILGSMAHKLIKIVVGKALSKVVEYGEYAAVKFWEKKARSFEGFCGGRTSAELLGGEPVQFEDWDSLQGKRALLFLHGTTSTTRGAFYGLTNFSEVTGALWKKYQGRVLGFDHHTLTKSVAENVIDFYNVLRPGNYTFDVITHSRGGLVARAIAELSDQDISCLANQQQWQRPAGVHVSFGKLAFVGTPNDGTALADPQNLPGKLDLIANMIEALPDSNLTLALGAVFATAAYVSETGLKALPGLVDMDPDSPLLIRLNGGRGSRVQPDQCFAVESNYMPKANIVAEAVAAGVAELFHHKENDLVVPTRGVGQAGSLVLPAANVLPYGPSDGVYHTHYFFHERTWNHLGIAFQLGPPGPAQPSAGQSPAPGGSRRGGA